MQYGISTIYGVKDTFPVDSGLEQNESFSGEDCGRQSNLLSYNMEDRGVQVNDMFSPAVANLMYIKCMKPRVI